MGGDAVEPINEILREEGIVYRLTPWTETTVPGKTVLLGMTRPANTRKINYPVFVKAENEFSYSQTLVPCITILSDSRFAVANDEFSRGNRAFRDSKFDEAMTLWGSAYERVLKTVCHEKGWQYNPNDTCASLLDICKSNNLFPPFYSAILMSTGTIRNKLSAAHGRGPSRIHSADEAMAEHMMRMVASNIILLARLAQF